MTLTDDLEEVVAARELPEPTHLWNGREDGHNCADCPNGSLWRCDRAAHPTVDLTDLAHPRSIGRPATGGLITDQHRHYDPTPSSKKEGSS